MPAAGPPALTRARWPARGRSTAPPARARGWCWRRRPRSSSTPSRRWRDPPAPARRPRVAVVTVSGGPSVVAADTAEREGLEVPALRDGHRRRCARCCRRSRRSATRGSHAAGRAREHRRRGAVASSTSRAIAGVVAVNVGLDIPEFADGVVAARAATGKPAVAFTADAPQITARFARAACRCCRAPSAPCERGARSGGPGRRRRRVARPARPLAGRGAPRARRDAAARCRTRWPGACWRRAASASVARRSWPTEDGGGPRGRGDRLPGRGEGRRGRAHPQDRGRRRACSTSPTRRRCGRPAPSSAPARAPRGSSSRSGWDPGSSCCSGAPA